MAGKSSVTAIEDKLCQLVAFQLHISHKDEMLASGGKMEPFIKDHLSTCECLTSLRHKPQQT